jgi:hypothetical protein
MLKYTPLGFEELSRDSFTFALLEITEANFKAFFSGFAWSDCGKPQNHQPALATDTTCP